MRNDPKYSIAIVDDDPDDRESIRDAFLENKYQHEYLFFGTADELLGYLQNVKVNSRPALILLDLNLPGMDGREALKEIKQNQEFRHIPIVVLSTSSSYIDKEASYSLGANCFITKPDTFSKLKDITDSIAKLWVE
ncbi:MAG TPA: response regulator [Chitinophagaceae bacterium]